MQPLDVLRNLMLMAAADGQITADELELLEARRVAWGISQDDFQEARRAAESVDGRLSVPEEPDRRYDFLQDMIAVMAADGHVDPLEMHLFALAAARLELSPDELEEILADFRAEDELILGDEGPHAKE